MPKANFVLKTSENIDVALYPPQEVNVTQGYGGSYSHVDTYNLDNAGSVLTVEGRKVYAPFKMKVVQNNNTVSEPGYGIVIYHSINKVLTPSGLHHVTMVLMHDDTSYLWSLGREFNQGQYCYQEGKADPSELTTGIHVHMEFALGHETLRVQTGGNFHIKNQVKVEDAVFINGSTFINANHDAPNTITPQFKTYTGGVLEWYDEEQTYLSESQSMHNAQIVVNHLFYNNKNWDKKSISALLGNMRHESTVNPNLYEMGYTWEEDRGYGLVQWTPRSKYWNWAISQGLEPRKGESQLARIDYEVEENIQWIPISRYNYMTFEEFRTNSGNWTVEYLTESFTWSYERPNASAGENSMGARKSFALRVFNEINWSGGGGVIDPDPPQEERNNKIMHLYMLDIIKGGYNGKF